MKKLFLIKTCALGNGRRQAGECLCQFEGNLDDAVGSIRKDRSLKKAGTFKLEPGVIEKEVITALNNNFLTDKAPAKEEEGGQDEMAAKNAIKVADLQLPDEIKACLAAAGLATVGDVDRYADAKGGLTDIPGVDQMAQMAIVGAVANASTATVDDI